VPRTTIVIGNGLGMSLDPDYFSLAVALREVWTGSDDFHSAHKRLVQSAIPGLTDHDFPQTEEQLDQLQVALVASEFLREFENEEIRWLANEAHDLPEAFKRFIHEVASYFHLSNQVLPLEFTRHLSLFIERTKSHIATLNYDNLLYDALTGTGILSGYNGSLLDGFLREGFAENNLDRFNVARHGWYLHLHGSPLYVGNRKLMREERRIFQPDEDSHIVLTHVQHKPLIIERSPILTAYWKRFHKALAESDRFILFGYSGNDTHLNTSIAERAIGKEICIVEWQGAGEPDARTRYWRNALNVAHVRVIQEENILHFQRWINP